MMRYVHFSALVLLASARLLHAAPAKSRPNVSPHGVTRSLITADGRREILETSEPTHDGNAMSYHAVTRSGAALQYDELRSVSTPFGKAKLAVDGERLQHEITIVGRRFRVTLHHDGGLEYRDERGRRFEGAPRVDGALVTPEGPTRSLITREGKKDVVVVEPRPDGSGYAALRQYRIAKVANGHLEYAPLEIFETPYGYAKLVESRGRLLDQIEARGVVYNVSRTPGGSFIFVGPDGKRHFDVIREGRGLVTPDGITRPVSTASGRRDLLTVATKNGEGTTLEHAFIAPTPGSFTVERVDGLQTQVGPTTPIVEKGRLVQRIELGGRRFEVTLNQDGHERFKDERGNIFVGAPRVRGAIVTADGVSKTYDSASGKVDVVVSKHTVGKGSGSVPQSHNIVSVVNGSLSVQPVQPLITPYGTTSVVASGRRIRQALRVRAQDYEVSQNQQGVFQYRREGGALYVGSLREGGRIVLPDGTLTQPVRTAEGRFEVIKTTRQRYNAKGRLVNAQAYQRVDGTKGPQASSFIVPHHTVFGEAMLVERGHRLRHELEVGGRRFEVIDDGTERFSYRDRRGRVFKDAPRIGTAIYTPFGPTRSMVIEGEPHDILVQKTYGKRSYYITTMVDGQARFEPLKDIETSFGTAKLVASRDEIRHQIVIEGRKYRVARTAASYAFVDEQGKPLHDDWMEKIATSTKWTHVVKRPYRKGLPPLSDDTIVQIQDSSGSATDHMSKETYEQLRDAMVEAMRMYDPSTHYFVGLGSDPHPIIAFLQNLGGNRLATNFPASGKYDEGLPVRTLDPYIRKLIPPEVLNGSKTLVLLDQTTSTVGREGTLAQIAPLFQQYLVGIGSPAKVVQLAFSPYPHPDGTGVIDTNKYPEVGKFLGAPYEHVVSQYDRHVLGQNTLNEFVERPGYGQFKDAMLQRMQRDEQLDQFLGEQAAAAKTN